MLENLTKAAGAWDVLVIGGGATGLGTALEASSRGYRTLLLERADFAKGTSSRSTKLVHGGVRYLRQGDIGLVRGALKERGILLRNAPHLTRPLPFVLPVYAWWEAPFFLAGLKLYDLLAGQLGLGRSRYLSRAETLRRVPTLQPKRLKGGVLYYDAQFDDARLALALAQSAADHGAVLVNYMPVESIQKTEGRVCGVTARDLENGRLHQIPCRALVNATGVFCDGVRTLDDPQAASMVIASQGTHIVLERAFLPGDSAVVFPKTDDGRILFALPWEGRVLVGTTDNPVSEISEEPVPLTTEIDFLVSHASRFLTKEPRREDVLSVFAGLRPLVSHGDSKATASLSREHDLSVSDSGMVTITGGKWTTYRKMGEEAVDLAARTAGLPGKSSVTSGLKLHGWSRRPPEGFQFHGSESDQVAALAESDPRLSEPIHPRLACSTAEVLWSVRHEMARTVDDILSRRSRSLLLDARASWEAAPKVAQVMALELGRDPAWVKEQVESFRQLAQAYLASATV